MSPPAASCIDMPADRSTTGLTARLAAFAIFTAVLTLAGWPVARELWGYATTHAAASHLVVVPPIAVALIAIRRRAIFARPRTDWRAAAVLAVIGAGSLWVRGVLDPGDQASSLGLAVAGLLAIWVGGFAAAFGAGAVRAARFPLLFLVFAAPIPGPLLEGVNNMLRHGSAAVVSGVLSLSMTPVQRDGFVFAFPGFAIEIADNCTGIRSSIALFLSGVLASGLVLTRSWTRALLCALILPVALLKNGIRICALVWLTMYRDAGYLSGRLHHEGGALFFLMALGLLGPILWLLAATERGHAADAVRQA